MVDKSGYCGYYWKAKPVEDLTREELIKALIHSMDFNRQQQETARKMWELRSRNA